MTTATQVQIRRSPTSVLVTKTPAEGEIGMDTTTRSLIAGDGTTPGGIRQATEPYVQAQIATIAIGVFQNEYLFDNCE